MSPDPAAEYEVTRVVPLGDASHAYRLAVPRGWAYGSTVGRATDLETVARPIGSFARGSDRAMSIVVTVTALPAEVRLEEWVGADMVDAGWQLLEMGWHVVHGLPKLAVLARRAGLVRAVAAMADGGRLYCVHVHGTQAQAAELERHLWWSAMAFRPCHLGGPDRLEARQSVVLGAYRFEAPISWELRPPVSTATDVQRDLLLRHPEGAYRGQLSVRARGGVPGDAEALREHTLARLRQRGWILARRIEAPVAPWRGVPRDWELRHVQARTPAGAVVDLELVHGRRGEAGVELIASGSRAYPRSWMRITRALEIACATLRAADPTGVT